LPKVLFRNYVYVSGTSPVMVQHLKEYAVDAIEMCGVQKGDFVFEFGSNDGTLLKHFQELDMKTLGMDPAKNIADMATANGQETIADFFGAATAKEVRAKHGAARLICANHCCAHIDDFHGVVQGVKELLAPEGVWIFEVGYLLEVFNKGLFDTIYHEHVDFHSVEPIRRFCDANGLKLLSASTNSIQGGSLRCYVGWDKTTPALKGGADSVAELIRQEVAISLHSQQTFKRWVGLSRRLAETKITQQTQRVVFRALSLPTTHITLSSASTPPTMFRP
jgi:SAM-dependent methyltransferase